MNDTPTPLRVRLERKVMEAEGIARFEFVHASGGALPAFTAGAHIDVLLSEALVRQYSLCNAPAQQDRYVLGVLLEPASRGGSQAMHALAEGDEISVSVPRNHFELAPEAERSLLIAGGIGVTPILAMAETLAAAGADFEFHYCSRSQARTAFRDRLAAAAYADRLRHHFDDGPQAQRFDIAATLARPAPGTHLYVCGPKGFMDAVLESARAQGWPEAQLHYEYFAGAEVDTTGDQAFDVRLARSGRTVHVAADQSVTAALTAAGVDLPVSCEQGVCGTCLTRVLDGTPEHRDMYLTPEEQAANDQFTPCCSRARSKLLVLDL